ncbi:head-tail connector protein [Streptomyces marianii]|uniref:Phage gp6-like head-tail connector protein n=1 Tax=Streptomyces marianii TaxID=1817406 RepID=A0A5R9E9N4_9ACTN|nr:head-tail connector protein [Streptomyces marianii]TLQ45755.1 phage gp6-like head-tail connector protein [Streptomyces marianii]
MSEPQNYATLADLKARLKIADEVRDELLEQALTSASRSIDKLTGRRFWLDAAAEPRTISPLRRTVVDEDGSHLLIKDLGSLDDLVVEVGRGSAWSDVTEWVEPEPTEALDEQQPVTSLLLVSGAWPRGGGMRVRVTGKWGWPEVPDVVTEATLLQANRLFKRKDSPEGVLGSAEWGVIRVSRVDPDVHSLVQHLVLPGIA